MSVILFCMNSFLIHLLRGLREAVLSGNAEQYAREFFQNYYKYDGKGIPEWIKHAMVECGVKL